MIKTQRASVFLYNRTYGNGVPVPSTSSNIGLAAQPVVSAEVIAEESSRKQRINTRKIVPTQGFTSKQAAVNSKTNDLFTKHAKHFANKERANSIYDIVERFSFNSYALPNELEAAMRFIKDPKFDPSVLTDRQIATLFRATGSPGVFSKPKLRIRYAKELQDVLRKKGVKIQLGARNALICSQIENGVQLSVVEVLKEFEAAGIEPSAETLGILSRIYAQKGDFVGIVEMVNHLKKSGVSVPMDIFDSLVYALALTDRDEQAYAVIESFKELEGNLRVAFATAKAQNLQLDKMEEVLSCASEAAWKSKEMKKLTRPIIKLAEKGSREGIQRLLNFVQLDEAGKLQDQMAGLDISSKLCELLYSNVKAALLLYEILGSEQAAKQRRRLKEHLVSFIKNCDDVPRIVETAKLFGESGLLSHPHTRMVEMALEIRPPIFYPIYESFLSSEEYKELSGNRPHILLPRVIHFARSLDAAKTPEEKVEILHTIGKSLLDGDKQDENVYRIENYFSSILAWRNKYYINPILRDLKILPPLLDVLSGYQRALTADMVMGELIMRKMFDSLNEMIDGPLKEAKIITSWTGNALAQWIIRLEPGGRDFNTASKLLSFNFPPADKRYQTSEKAMGVIERVLSSDSVKYEKARRIFDAWAKEERIRLSSEDAKKVLARLEKVGVKQKAEALRAIIEKPKTLERWKNTEDISQLVKEAKTIIMGSNNSEKPAVLERLFSVICEKCLSKNPKDWENMIWVLERYSEMPECTTVRPYDYAAVMNAAMREALLSNQIAVADAVWKTSSTKLGIVMKISYAAVLHRLQLREKLDEVLNNIKTVPRFLQLDEASDIFITPSVESLRFIKELSEKVRLEPESKRKMIDNARRKIFNQLLADGKFEEALAFANDVGIESSRAFGQMELMGAALDKGDMKLLQNVITMVQNRHDKNTALIDFGVALLEKGKTEHASRVFGASGLHINKGKMEYFIKREIQSRRPDVLVHLFTNLNVEEKASTSDLTRLAMSAVRLFGNEGNTEGITAFEEELKRTSFPMNEALKKEISYNLKKTLRKTADAVASDLTSSKS